MDKNLIFVLGAERGGDSKFFLEKDYKVISVECNPAVLGELQQNLRIYYNSIICNACLNNKEGLVPFYSSEVNVWSSCNKKIANRENKCYHKHYVNGIKLHALIEEFGVPYYMKIDIEGNDVICIRQLANEEKPLYISAESECLTDDAKENKEGDEFLVLDAMKDVGYTKFYIEEQTSHETSLEPWEIKDWQKYEEVKEYIVKNGPKSREKSNFSFWCDIYATY